MAIYLEAYSKLGNDDILKRGILASVKLYFIENKYSFSNVVQCSSSTILQECVTMEIASILNLVYMISICLCVHVQVFAFNICLTSQFPLNKHVPRALFLSFRFYLSAFLSLTPFYEIFSSLFLSLCASLSLVSATFYFIVLTPMHIKHINDSHRQDSCTHARTHPNFHI